MNTPQEAIFKQGSNQFTFLEYKLLNNNLPLLKKALQEISALKTTTNLVMGFGAHLWTQINPSWTPKGLVDFKSLSGKNGFEMPSTQSDLLFWFHSDKIDQNLDVAITIHDVLQGLAEKVIDQNGFTYRDSRDLTGFEDGTANPKDEKKYEAALIQQGEPGEGGSFLFTQKWLHNLGKFNSRPVSEQEKIIGRTKKESIELEGDDMPDNSHVSRTDAKVDGVAMKIYRRSAPFGNADEHGLFFISFACDLFRVQIQLERMLGMTEDGITDRIMEFSTPVSGAYWFAPSEEDLLALMQ